MEKKREDGDEPEKNSQNYSYSKQKTLRAAAASINTAVATKSATQSCPSLLK